MIQFPCVVEVREDGHHVIFFKVPPILLIFYASSWDGVVQEIRSKFISVDPQWEIDINGSEKEGRITVTSWPKNPELPIRMGYMSFYEYRIHSADELPRPNQFDPTLHRMLTTEDEEEVLALHQWLKSWKARTKNDPIMDSEQ